MAAALAARAGVVAGRPWAGEARAAIMAAAFLVVADAGLEGAVMAPAAAAVGLPWAGEDRAAIMAVAFLVVAGTDPEGAAMAPVVRAAAVTITAEREIGSAPCGVGLF
ncbi:hypothetical protein AA15973_1443 [Komagataeibacter sucrofermentans DSM 15973]|nr:hypothetical protein AA15973_1443 [Komagataeibacter sucrofermentans DSM 15973]